MPDWNVSDKIFCSNHFKEEHFQIYIFDGHFLTTFCKKVSAYYMLFRHSLIQIEGAHAITTEMGTQPLATSD